MSVEFSLDHDIARITIDRDDKRNAFDAGIIATLTRSLEQVAEHPEVRAVVLASKGKHFSAGADLAWMRSMAEMDHDDNIADAGRLAALMDAIDQCPRPVVVRVQGAAFGGALGLICAADIAVAADDARFCLTEVRLGILPAVIAPYVVRALGQRQARRFFMTAEVIPATSAQELALVHRVVPGDQLDAAVEEQLELLRGGAPGAQCRARELVERVAHGPVDQAMREYTAHLIAELRGASEGREGLAAFLEKRKPAWQTPGEENSS
jgi:methylglutaconyl-CoA hydratase